MLPPPKPPVGKANKQFDVVSVTKLAYLFFTLVLAAASPRRVGDHESQQRLLQKDVQERPMHHQDQGNSFFSCPSHLNISAD